MNLATFVIALVPGQASIEHIGVRDIGADVMVVVPLELGGGEDKEGEKNDALSADASFGFEASLPSAQYSQSVASNDGAGGGPLISPELTESGASSSSVRRVLQRCCLGRTFVSSAGAVVGEDILQQSLRDCFAGKAVETLVEGVPDFTRFVEFQVSCNNGRPLSQSEHDWHDCLCYLRQQGAGATKGESFISAWKFMQDTVGAGANGTDIILGRVRGASEDLMAKKRKLQQALALPAEVVWELEGLMTKKIQPKINVILGFMLFCMVFVSGLQTLHVLTGW